jgi:sulfur-carrier protein
MSIKIRFLGQLQELLGSNIEVESEKNATLAIIVKRAAEKNKLGYDIIFDEQGKFRQYVILLQNGNRIETFDTGKAVAVHDDDITVFLPVSGG